MRAAQTLLSLALLLEQVITTMAFHRHFSRAGSANPLLCAAVRLELGHVGEEYRG